MRGTAGVGAGPAPGMLRPSGVRRSRMGGAERLHFWTTALSAELQGVPLSLCLSVRLKC